MTIKKQVTTLPRQSTVLLVATRWFNGHLSRRTWASWFPLSYVHPTWPRSSYRQRSAIVPSQSPHQGPGTVCLRQSGPRRPYRRFAVNWKLSFFARATTDIVINCTRWRALIRAHTSAEEYVVVHSVKPVHNVEFTLVTNTPCIYDSFDSLRSRSDVTSCLTNGGLRHKHVVYIASDTKQC